LQGGFHHLDIVAVHNKRPAIGGPIKEGEFQGGKERRERWLETVSLWKESGRENAGGWKAKSI